MPSASLGSNQVDLGGMMPPASATAIRSSMLRREEREGDRHLARVDPPLELAEAAPAADEVDALVGARVGDAEQRLDQVAREQRDRQPADRIASRHEIAPQLQPIPAPAQEHAELARRARVAPATPTA